MSHVDTRHSVVDRPISTKFHTTINNIHISKIQKNKEKIPIIDDLTKGRIFAKIYCSLENFVDCKSKIEMHNVITIFTSYSLKKISSKSNQKWALQSEHRRFITARGGSRGR